MGADEPTWGPSMGRKSTAVVLVVAQLVMLSACLSVQATGSRPSEGPGGGVAVRVFPNDSAARANQPGPAGILSKLERREGDRWEPVFHSLNPTWAVAGLPPGDYRLSFPARLDDAGNVVRLKQDTTTVRAREGRITETQAVLEHVNPALVVAGVVTAVAAAVVISKYVSDHGLPEPPLPPPELLDAVIYVSVDLSAAHRWEGVSDSLPPAVTSHFPASGALVAARRPRIVFAMTEPLRGTELKADGITVLGESSGLIPGQVSYDASNWWVVWEPQADLPGGDTFHVTLAPDAVEDSGGNEMKAPASFTFSTVK